MNGSMDTNSTPGRRVMGVGAGIAAIVALAISTQTYFSMLGHGHSFGRILMWQLGCWTFWGLAAPFALRRGAELGVRRRDAVPRVVALGLILLVAHGVVTSELTIWIQPFMPVVTYDRAGTFVRQLPSYLVIDLSVYVVLLVIGGGLAARNRARQLELRESRLEAELARAQLHALRLEIEPHFLFNTLNAIAALIRLRDNARALEMLVDLGDFMRTNLDQPRRQFVPLSAEIEWVHRYVKLQQTRFGDRLDVRYEIDGDCLDHAVPTLLLQPIVENALRHGAARQTQRCRVAIAATAERANLTITITDDGAGVPPDFDINRQAGTGLRNIRSRLEHLYGTAAALDIGAGDRGGTTVRVHLPIARTTPADRATA